MAVRPKAFALGLIFAATLLLSALAHGPTQRHRPFMRRLNQQTSVNGGEMNASAPAGAQTSGGCCAQLASIAFSSDLPVVIITAPLTIQHKVKQDVELCTCANGASFEDYNGFATAAGRGSSSANFAKKSYRLELQKPGGAGKDKFELLGMPKDDDWIL
jgi:hypothetical protein